MGISSTTLEQFRLFRKQFVFASVCSVCELGSQDLHCQGEHEAILETLKEFGCDTHVGELDSGRKFYEAIGLRYSCIDIDGREGSVPLDLNFESVSPVERGQYDFVTNFGTTEHVANQLNCLEVMHDLASTGGYLYHEVPMTGMLNHGLVSYSPKLFWLLCKANRYELVDLFVWNNGERRVLQDRIPAEARLRCTPDFSWYDSMLACLMKKVHDAPFFPPLDGELRGGDMKTRLRYFADKK